MTQRLTRRIQWFCLLVVILGVGCLGFIHNKPAVFLGWFALGAAGGSLFVVLCTFVYEGRQYDAARKLFGEEFGVCDWKTIKLLQPRVDMLLELVAQAMDDAFKRENAVLTSNPLSEAAARGSLVDLGIERETAKRKKNEFWSTLDTVEYFGFAVRKSYKDYLSNVPFDRNKMVAKEI